MMAWIVCVGLLGACGDDDDSAGAAAGTGMAGATATGGTMAAGGMTGGTMGTAGTMAAGAGGGDTCVADFMASGRTMECAQCACTMCATQAADLAAGDATFQMNARAILDCAVANCCSGTNCYCGDDVAACTSAPAGACVQQVETAAGATGLAGIAGPCGDKTNACGAASLLGRCLTGDAISGTMGMCPACEPTGCGM